MQVKTILENKNYNQDSNVNVNNIKLNNVNVNRVKVIAERLSTKLQDENPVSLLFYYKVGWKLPQNVIENNLEAALKGREPKKLFVYLCKLQGL